jgi:hypothetical protein
MRGIGTVMGVEQFDGSIRSRHQLSGVVDSHLVVSIPHLVTHSDIIRARWRKIFVTLVLVVIFAALGGLAAAIVSNFPIDFPWADKAGIGFPAARQ